MSVRTATVKLFFALLLVGLAIDQHSIAQPPDSAQKGQAKGEEWRSDNTRKTGGKEGRPQENSKPGGKEWRSGNDPTPKERQRNSSNIDLSIGLQFNINQKNVVRDYYNDMYRSGKCPPGLAKKNNGCQPPGQAKQWRKGYPLDSGITFHALDKGLLAKLGNPPSGYKYVRVASDILMLGVGTNLVVDAIENLGHY